MTAANDDAVRYDHRADRNPALAQSVLRLSDRGLQKRIGAHVRILAIIASYSKMFGPSGASWAMLTIARATVSALIGR